VFRKSDIFVEIDGHIYTLRLSLGALAEIDARLCVNGPLELAEKFKQLSAGEDSASDACILLECLLRSSLPPHVTNIPAIAKKAEPDVYLPRIAEVFEISFARAS